MKKETISRVLQPKDCLDIQTDGYIILYVLYTVEYCMNALRAQVLHTVKIGTIWVIVEYSLEWIWVNVFMNMNVLTAKLNM